MGHIHLGVLPKTRKWTEVVDLLAGGGTDEGVIAASIRASDLDLLRAANSPTFVEAVRLLAMVPVAARSDDFGEALRQLDVPARNAPDLYDIVGAIGQRLDDVARKDHSRSDFAELSRRALLSALTCHVGDRMPRLLSTTPQDVQLVFRSLSAPRAFAVLARGFYTRLLGETLRYWLDRELAHHIGEGRRFSDAGARSQFDAGLMQFCMEATFIVQEFAAGWQSKTLRRDGQISCNAAAAFGAVAFKKIREELQLKWHGNE